MGYLTERINETLDGLASWPALVTETIPVRVENIRAMRFLFIHDSETGKQTTRHSS